MATTQFEKVVLPKINTLRLLASSGCLIYPVKALDLSHVDESGQARFSPKETLQCGRCSIDDVA
ncbi:hypothetical protein CFP56_011928 [Quercus suber]|uniref:Uncharacterized protein n=1 Tax=Quercus suber TaxID=58331 RepID=A0AAW0KWH7_QUESU